MQKTTKTYNLFLGFGLLFLFLITKKVNAQIVIGKPSLGFSQACAGESFNSYYASFAFSPENQLASNNQFSVELSDSAGDFTDSQIITISNTGSVTVSPHTINFSLPEDTAGENYKIRIRSSAPEAVSQPSNGFPAYYKIQDDPFTINNLEETGSYCFGGDFLLTVDNPGIDDNDSPLNYDSLTINWFKETGPTTDEYITTSPSFSVTEEGTYFARTNYGSCTSNSVSNKVIVTQRTSGDLETTITSSLGNPFCPMQDETTTLSTSTGDTYQWYKDGDIIDEATEQTYEAIDSGLYSVKVSTGGCNANGQIELVSQLFTASIDALETNEIIGDETLLVTVTEEASDPIFEWYLNDEIIEGETNSNYTIDTEGDYKVVIYETEGCTNFITFEFEVTRGIDLFPNVEKIPNVVSPNGDSINDKWIIPVSYVTGTNTNVIILDSRGKKVLETDNYLNDWPDNSLIPATINQVFYYILSNNNETKKGSITVIK